MGPSLRLCCKAPPPSPSHSDSLAPAATTHFPHFPEGSEKTHPSYGGIQAPACTLFCKCRMFEGSQGLPRGHKSLLGSIISSAQTRPLPGTYTHFTRNRACSALLHSLRLPPPLGAAGSQLGLGETLGDLNRQPPLSQPLPAATSTTITPPPPSSHGKGQEDVTKLKGLAEKEEETVSLVFKGCQSCWCRQATPSPRISPKPQGPWAPKFSVVLKR